MGGTGEDAAEDNPEIGSRTKLGAHDGTEDRTCTCNVKKLNHEYLPVGKNDEIKTVGLSHGRSHTVVWCEHFLYEASVEQITQKKSHEAHHKSNHFLS